MLRLIVIPADACAFEELCVLSYFEGTENVHSYTSCTLTTLHCSKVSFLQCCHMKRYNKIFTKNVRGVLTSVRYCVSNI